MKLLSFSNRVVKETVRDPLNLAFGIGFPVILLLLLSAIQANVPVDLFEISRLAPGICVFGLSFMTLFSALLVRTSAKQILARHCGGLRFSCSGYHRRKKDFSPKQPYRPLGCCM